MVKNKEITEPPTEPTEPTEPPTEPTEPTEPPTEPTEPPIIAEKVIDTEGVSKKKKKVVETVDETESVTAVFFTDNPTVKRVLKTGEMLFLDGHYGAARDAAKRLGCTVETVENPFL